MDFLLRGKAAAAEVGEAKTENKNNSLKLNQNELK